MRTERQFNRLEQLAAERDKRRAPRLGTRDLAVVTLGQSADVKAGESFPIQLHDLSMRGVRFTGRLPIARDDAFVLHLPIENQRVSLLATAVHVTKSKDGQLTVGAEFTGTLHATSHDPNPAYLEEAEMSRMRAMMLGN